ncbi:MAG: hypothetical protein AAB263_16360 [Planctomycetota bacterium]
MRLIASLIACAAMVAAEYAPTVDQTRLYTWTVDQSADWASAGDKLHFDTKITWGMALRCVAVTAQRVQLNATFVTLKATHTGPGVNVRIDGETGAGADDPLLGHLLALKGQTLVLDVDRSTGVVSSVNGGDEIIAEINKRAPASMPGDPPPLDASARLAYSSESLSRLWSQILALPVNDKKVAVPLPAPFVPGTTAERSWKGSEWTVALASDAKAPAFEISKDPSGVRGVVKKLAGSGSMAISAGLPAKATGKLTFTLAMEALTQPVESQHELKWELAELKSP